MEDLYPDGFNFVHNNSRVLEGWLENEGIELVKFPTYSPDLNPIENLWGTLKNYVASDRLKTKNQLKESLAKNWEQLTHPHHLDDYINGLEERYEMVIENGGERLN